MIDIDDSSVLKFEFELWQHWHSRLLRLAFLRDAFNDKLPIYLLTEWSSLFVPKALFQNSTNHHENLAVCSVDQARSDDAKRSEASDFSKAFSICVRTFAQRISAIIRYFYKSTLHR